MKIFSENMSDPEPIKIAIIKKCSTLLRIYGSVSYLRSRLVVSDCNEVLPPSQTYILVFKRTVHFFRRLRLSDTIPGSDWAYHYTITVILMSEAEDLWTWSPASQAKSIFQSAWSCENTSVLLRFSGSFSQSWHFPSNITITVEFLILKFFFCFCYLVLPSLL